MISHLDNSFNIETFNCVEKPCLASVQQSNEHVPECDNDLDINLSNSDLTDSQKSQLQNFLQANRKVFAKNLSELGSTNVYKHKIETVDDIPVRSRHHRMSQQMKTLVEKEIAGTK